MNRNRTARQLAWLTAVSFLSTGLAAAQTPTDREPQPPAATATSGQTDQPGKIGKIDAIRTYIKDRRLVERFGSENGVYPLFGGLPTGAGLTGGVGYRRNFLDKHALFRTTALVSTHAYVGLAAEQSFEGMGKPGAFAGVRGTFLRVTQESFYGIGSDSSLSNRTNYGMNTGAVTGTVGVKPLSWLRVGGRLGYQSSAFHTGGDSQSPTTEALFGDAITPALLEQPNYLTSGLFATLDTRDAPGNARSGSYFRIDHMFFRDRDFNRYSFDRSEIEVMHFFPFAAKKQTLALRARMTVSDPRSGNAVPFYLLPTVGGGNTVRSLHEYRFRDRNALVMNAEYRWKVARMIDLAVLADAGRVSPNVGFTDLKGALGGGIRIATGGHVFFRLDVAKGSEGTRAYMKFSPSF